MDLWQFAPADDLAVAGTVYVNAIEISGRGQHQELSGSQEEEAAATSKIGKT